jgi:cystathionine gamma-synthase
VGDAPLDTFAPDTLAVVAGRPARVPDAPLGQPIVLASTYHAGGPVGYGRDGNPTWSALEEALGALEGGLALVFASGMGAAATALALLPAGARVVLSRVSYSGVMGLTGDLERRGVIERTLADLTDADATLAATVGASLLWLETPSNPLLELADLDVLCVGAHERGALVVVDNTFATPLLQRPLDHGADIVVHSAAKLLAGHSDVLLGALVVRDPDVRDRLAHARLLDGAIPGAFDAFLALRGVRTLPVRLERAQASAGVLAGRLARHRAVSRVRYPGLQEHPGHDIAKRQMRGFGSILSFETGGGAEAAQRVAEGTRLVVHATSLGGVESLIERRRRWPAEAPEVPESLLRLSVGCEHVEDLWADLEQALDRA